jgi:nicotinate-nucleotide adenylyltransferase
MIFTPPNLKDSPRWNGLRVGLLGGSFNPAHHGHMHIARLALAKLKLDFIWWLVTPQNPLKDRADMAPYEKRFHSVEAMIDGHPRMMATHLERMLGTTYTYDTVQKLMKLYPRTDFTFICGMDNARIFHRWDRWRELADMIPVAFIARPPAGRLVQNCPARMLNHPNIIWLKGAKMVDISSSHIRKSLNNNSLPLRNV